MESDNRMIMKPSGFCGINCYDALMTPCNGSFVQTNVTPYSTVNVIIRNDEKENDERTVTDGER